MSSLTYDTGALMAAERGDRKMWLLHRRALDRSLRPTVPAGVLAQAWRGGPQAQISRLLSGCRIEVFDEVRARSAGAACAMAKTADVVDASVVVGGAVRGDLIITSDPDDITALAGALGVQVKIHTV